MDKKRILFVIYSLGQGGAERSLTNLLNFLPPERYDIDLQLFSKTGSFLKALPDWVHVLDVPHGLNEAYNGFHPRSLRDLRWLPVVIERYFWTPISRRLSKGNMKRSRQLRWKFSYKRCLPRQKGEYDIAVGYADGEPMYYVIDKVNARRKIGRICNDYCKSGWDPALDLPYYTALDGLFSVSESSAKIFEGFFPQLKGKATVTHNIISPTVVRTMAEAFEPEEIDKSCFAVLSIGRLCEQKGYDIALEAFAMLKRQGIAFRYYIMGIGDDREKLDALCQKLGIQEDVVFLGLKDNPYPYIRACDVILQSSRWEGKSNVLDEAKVLTRPILSTNYPTVVDQIHPGEGVIVDLTPEAVADGLKDLMTHPEKRQALTAYLAAHDYGTESLVQDYIRVLEGAPGD
ncbi:MAG: glycosyltransferase [Clostridia bacterium]|nr:glycosyltransferase [Clostridia bacterium]